MTLANWPFGDDQWALFVAHGLSTWNEIRAAIEDDSIYGVPGVGDGKVATLKGLVNLKAEDTEPCPESPAADPVAAMASAVGDLDASVVGNRVADHADWLETRKLGLGSSDAPVVLGERGNRYELWARKRDMVETPDLSKVEWIEWGNRLEQPIAQKYREVTGYEVQLNGFLFRSVFYEWLQATPDAFCWCPTRGLGICEVKNVTSWKAGDWEEEPPDAVKIQVQHQLACLGPGVQWADVAALIGGHKFVSYGVERDENFIGWMVSRLERFWGHVENGTEPPKTQPTAEVLAALYPEDLGGCVQLPQEFVPIHRALQEAKAGRKHSEALEEFCKIRIKHEMGEARTAIVPGENWAYSWKTGKDGRRRFSGKEMTE